MSTRYVTFTSCSDIRRAMEMRVMIFAMKLTAKQPFA